MSAERTGPGFRRFLGRFGADARRREADETDASGVRARGTDGARVGARPSRAPVAVWLAVVAREAEELRGLEALAASVEGQVAGWVAIDATDDGLMGEMMPGLLGVEGRCAHRPGLTGAAARAEAISLAPREASHLLLLEPDMALRCDHRLDEALSGAPGDALTLRLEDGGFEHLRPLILRAGVEWTLADDARWSARGNRGAITAAFEPARVVRRADGPTMVARLTRDRASLYERIESDPTDPVVMFLLGRTLAALGETTASNWWFAKCAEAFGRGEEAYCSWYFVGESHLLEGDIDAAREAFIRALEARPSRVEAYHQLARIHNADRDFPTARMWAEAGMLQAPTRDALFNQPWVRRWGLPYQWALAAWWTGDAVAARSMLDSLRESGVLPEPFASEAARASVRAMPGSEPLRHG